MEQLKAQFDIKDIITLSSVILRVLPINTFKLIEDYQFILNYYQYNKVYNLKDDPKNFKHFVEHYNITDFKILEQQKTILKNMFKIQLNCINKYYTKILHKEYLKIQYNVNLHEYELKEYNDDYHKLWKYNKFLDVVAVLNESSF